MPELPEVETIVRDLRPRLVGRTIGRAVLSHTDLLRGVTRRKLVAALAGATIVSVERRAKHAVLGLEHTAPRSPFPAPRLVVQPGMTGSLIVHPRPLARAEAAYAVLRAPLDDGAELVYRDVRRLGTLLLLDPRGWAAYDAAIGPEPLADDWTPAALLRTLQGTRQAVKKVLMDQRKLAGVGNIYANEALWAARVDPSRPGFRVTAAEAEALHGHVRRILQAAIASHGTTLRDYRTGTGEEGSFQLELLAYGREGEPCRRCGTRLAGTHAIDARITVFCHRCQA
ncbi:MAG TPA: bifunctional DNA-formamidopyrimidine glycosylase/DNA-(apurinic or apyrimidinic site) lyase [Gemmatimonadales bacterium]|nr:bifunctional DNA-formamidopyrimidine glycosylase/DNA-(apurinic or apyrimidinic site) lyase [Gemmatimonadales bacterium]